MRAQVPYTCARAEYTRGKWQPRRYDDAFEGTRTILGSAGDLDNAGAYAAGTGSLRAQQFRARDGRVTYQLFFGWDASGWLFVSSGESLVFLLDGERVGFARAEGAGDREVVAGGVSERAMYEVPRNFLERLATATTVMVRAYGTHGARDFSAGKDVRCGVAALLVATADSAAPPPITTDVAAVPQAATPAAPSITAGSAWHDHMRFTPDGCRVTGEQMVCSVRVFNADSAGRKAKKLYVERAEVIDGSATLRADDAQIGPTKKHLHGFGAEVDETVPPADTAPLALFFGRATGANTVTLTIRTRNGALGSTGTVRLDDVPVAR